MTAEQRSRMRARILDAARVRFLEDGLDGLSMRSIAARVGVSSMTLYLYYESRQDIVRHIVLEGFVQLNDCLNSVALLGSRDEKLSKLGKAYLEFVKDNERYYAAMHRYFSDHESSKDDPILAQPVGHTLSLLSEIIRTGGASDADAKRKAAAVWAALHGLAMLHIGGQLTEAQIPLDDVLSTVSYSLI
jgi:AcrR family transcriptional regulator